MNKYIKILLVPALALGLSTGQAKADDEAVAAIGGFLGGIIATKVFDHHKSHRNHCSTTVIYSHGHHKHKCDHKCSHYRSNRHYKHGHHKHKCDRSCSHHRPSGHYETVRVREWVPGCWEVSYNRCGDRIRTWVPGHHTYVTKRVWVAHHDATRSHNGYAYNGHTRHR